MLTCHMNVILHVIILLSGGKSLANTNTKGKHVFVKKCEGLVYSFCLASCIV
ncbi:hypothetical protein MNBD_GAMMA25-2213 [hydrothermal vent metagenome]|uniref:Uncharacterized protein n=1 Tax=hydrothermal vent metagenome TaxID=652676 RepID=A0A3B1AUA7_9ZZZZ